MEIQSSSFSRKATLGQGYDINKESLCGNCVTGHQIFVGAPQSSVILDRSLSQEETASSLGFSLGGKARYGLAKASMSAKFARECMEDSFSVVTVYRAEYSFKNVRLVYDGLTPLVGKPAQESGNWNQICGNEYIEQIKLGASLYISMKIQFASAKAKESFSAKADLSSEAVAVSAKASEALMTSNSTGSISIIAFQLGGDVSRLSEIFSTVVEVDERGNNGYAITRCSIDRPDDCLKVFDKAIQYAADTTMPASFPNQIQITSSQSVGSPTGPAELSYITAPWSDLGILAKPEILSEISENAKKELADLFDRSLEAQNRIRYLLSEESLAGVADRQRLKDLEHNIDHNLVIIDDAATTCYGDASQCASVVAKAKDSLLPIDDNLLGGFLANLYDSIDNPSVDKELSGLIRRIEYYLRAVVRDWDSIPADQKGLVFAARVVLIDKLDLRCSTDEGFDLDRLLALGIDKLFSCLTGLVELDISGCRIQQICHLLGPRNKSLRYLSANDCHIKDLSGVSCLSGLEKLHLDNNLIDDISPLATLSSLQHLHLGNNQIEDVSPIRDLCDLRSLNLESNRIKDISPLSSLHSCEAMNLNSNPINNFLPITSMANSITVLGLAGNNLDSCSFLESFHKLKALDLSRNPIASIEALRSMQDLQMLDISFTEVATLGPLACCLQVQSLFISATDAYKDLTSLLDLPMLSCLVANDSGISRIDSIASLPNLSCLSLRGNCLTNVDLLKSCPRLSMLDLGYNMIEDISPFQGFPSLAGLSLIHNNITKIQSPSFRLTILLLAGNPMPRQEVQMSPNGACSWDSEVSLCADNIWALIS